MEFKKFQLFVAIISLLSVLAIGLLTVVGSYTSTESRNIIIGVFILNTMLFILCCYLLWIKKDKIVVKEG